MNKYIEHKKTLVDIKKLSYLKSRTDKLDSSIRRMTYKIMTICQTLFSQINLIPFKKRRIIN